MGNQYLYDWLTIATKNMDEQQAIDFLGMDYNDFEDIYGYYGYKHRLYYNGVGIHYDGRDDQGILIEMSGQGCRAFETYGCGDYDKLFDFCRAGYGKVNRLDIAYDDHTGVIDLYRLAEEAHAGNYVSRWRQCSITWTQKQGAPQEGLTVDFGSAKSDIKLRMYNKAAERGCEADQHWIRLELQLRDQRAMAFILDGGELAEKYTGVICNYLRFVEPVEGDSNKWRWPIADFWADFLGDAVALRLYTKPGVEYNIDRLARYALHTAGNATETLIDIMGIDAFVAALRSTKRLPNKHYERIKYSMMRLVPEFREVEDASPWDE